MQRATGNRFDKTLMLVHMREVLWDRSDRNDRPITTLLWMAKDRHTISISGWTGLPYWALQ